MRKIFLLLIPGLLVYSLVMAQQREHKIVFDFTKGDTASFATMMRQAKNIMNAAGNAKIEVVCYGPGLDMLTKE